jgi:Leucine-rich repeat (LRR) protein
MDIQNLKKIDLRAKAIVEIDQNIFNGLSNIVTILLDSNQIMEFI